MPTNSKHNHRLVSQEQFSIVKLLNDLAENWENEYKKHESYSGIHKILKDDSKKFRALAEILPELLHPKL